MSTTILTIDEQFKDSSSTATQQSIQIIPSSTTTTTTTTIPITSSSSKSTTHQSQPLDHHHHLRQVINNNHQVQSNQQINHHHHLLLLRSKIPGSFKQHPSSSLSSSSSSSPRSPLSVDHQHLQSNQNQLKKPSKSKTSLVTAIPASILKKDKPGLLSQEQKRANHIASEQKRRAAIRQGYNRLCLIVPSLRTPSSGGQAIHQNTHEAWLNNHKRSDEESPIEEPHPTVDLQQQNILSNLEDPSNNDLKTRSHSAPTKIRTTSLEIHRPGAKSEAVVLEKTVEYLRELESDRKRLLERLEKLTILASSRGILIDKKTKINLQRGGGLTDELDQADDNRLEVWERRWMGNIQEIDNRLNFSCPSLNPSPNPSAPLPADLFPNKLEKPLPQPFMDYHQVIQT